MTISTLYVLQKHCLIKQSEWIVFQKNNIKDSLMFEKAQKAIDYYGEMFTLFQFMEFDNHINITEKIDSLISNTIANITE